MCALSASATRLTALTPCGAHPTQTPVHGHSIKTIQVESEAAALEACSSIIECRGFTYNSSGINGSITSTTKVFLKKQASCTGGAPWTSWIKYAPVLPPAQLLQAPGLNVVRDWQSQPCCAASAFCPGLHGLDSFGMLSPQALRDSSYTVQWLNVSGVSTGAAGSFPWTTDHGPYDSLIARQ